MLVGILEKETGNNIFLLSLGFNRAHLATDTNVSMLLGK